jgi:hypothetical protein
MEPGAIIRNTASCSENLQLGGRFSTVPCHGWLACSSKVSLEHGYGKCSTQCHTFAKEVQSQQIEGALPANRLSTYYTSRCCSSRSLPSSEAGLTSLRKLYAILIKQCTSLSIRSLVDRRLQVTDTSASRCNSMLYYKNEAHSLCITSVDEEQEAATGGDVGPVRQAHLRDLGVVPYTCSLWRCRRDSIKYWIRDTALQSDF